MEVIIHLPRSKEGQEDASTSIENLLVLSCYFSMDSIPHGRAKIKKTVEMFAGKLDNISTVRRIPDKSSKRSTFHLYALLSLRYNKPVL